jgi:hypothetical protein
MIRGIVGHVKWHYYTAAAINGYTVTRAKGGGLSLVATVVMRDAFKLAQRPLTFEAPHKNGVWKWPIVSHELHESGRLVATLGPELPTSPEWGPPKDLCLDFSNPK